MALTVAKHDEEVECNGPAAVIEEVETALCWSLDSSKGVKLIAHGFQTT